MLSHTKVKSMKKPGRYGDGAGLMLVVSKTGAKSWILRAMQDGKRRDMGLGGFPKVSLADARKKAAEYHEELDAGRDPVAERRAVAAPVAPKFGQAVEAVYTANSHWSPPHASSWLKSLQRHAAPFWDCPVDEVSRKDVLGILTPLWANTADTGRRVRGRVREVMAWAVAHEWRSDNPAGESINGAIPKTRKGQRHHNAIDYRDAPAALAAIGMVGAVRLAIRFAVLTAARPGEARGARWSEIDLDARLWTIPAERMKTRTAQHRVPLSRPAMEGPRRCPRPRRWLRPRLPQPDQAGVRGLRCEPPQGASI